MEMGERGGDPEKDLAKTAAALWPMQTSRSVLPRAVVGQGVQHRDPPQHIECPSPPVTRIASAAADSAAFVIDVC